MQHSRPAEHTGALRKCRALPQPLSLELRFEPAKIPLQKMMSDIVPKHSVVEVAYEAYKWKGRVPHHDSVDTESSDGLCGRSTGSGGTCLPAETAQERTPVTMATGDFSYVHTAISPNGGLVWGRGGKQ